MKKLSVLFVLLLATLFFAIDTNLLLANSDVLHIEADLADVYEFPIKPGSEEWAAFESHREMVVATQIPDEVLINMSTEALIGTVLNYPLLGDMFAFNTMQQGFDAVEANFNGLTTLLQRPDAGTKLLTRYQQMDPTIVQNGRTLTETGQLAIEFSYVEILLTQPEFLEKLSNTELDILLAETIKKGEAKYSLHDTYGYSGQEKTISLMINALAMAYPDEMERLLSQEPFKYFLETGNAQTIDVLSDVVIHTQTLLNSDVPAYLIIDDDDPTILDSWGLVYTPNGTPVSVIVTSWELSSAEIAYYNGWVQTHYPSATRETNASRRYNCHSYAWYSQSTNNIRWMNAPEQKKYWQDGSYGYRSWQSPGYRVDYANDDHSAIIAYSPTAPYMFRSKWGQLPRMYHAPHYAPYNSSALHSYALN
jgi:hypothetical protein